MDVSHRNSDALQAPRGSTHRLGQLLMAAAATARRALLGPDARSGGAAVSQGRPDPSLARLIVRFALSGLLAMVIIGAAGFVIVRRSATSNAITQAKDLTQLAGRGIAAPLIGRGVLNGDPAALARLDHVVRTRIIRGTPIVRVKIWDGAGRIVYSDAGELIGTVFPLGADELRSVRGGGTIADESNLSRPENRTERGFEHLLEVYVGIRGSDGTRLLYEDYERASTIAATSRREWMSLLPALLGALLVLYLVQVPLAYSLARRLRARQREREQLLRRAIDASDMERRRIAADLHDGTVQRLAGVSLSLAASANALSVSGEQAGARARQALTGAAAETRETIRELRTLLVDIYPPTLQRSGLPAAMNDLVAPLRSGGIAVTLDIPDGLQLPGSTEALLYRVAQEALRNARTHGEPRTVELTIKADLRSATLCVSDDGRGFCPGDKDGRGDHFGLRLMRDLADHAGGALQVLSSPGHGTLVRLEVPLT
ncbi:MAG: sensor histidine kinase [Solirubrobacteraceae bacterium]